MMKKEQLVKGTMVRINDEGHLGRLTAGKDALTDRHPVALDDRTDQSFRGAESS